jgi:RNA polymerase sigma factor (TIGR02999 family)
MHWPEARHNGLNYMEDQPGAPNVAKLMAAFRTGDVEAASELVEIFYPELRRIAGMQIKGERKDHTLQATALVNELYLELIRIRRLHSGSADSEVERAEFLRLSAYLMRRLLIHHARPLSKRVNKVELDDRLAGSRPDEHLVRDVDRALDQLGSMDPKLRQVVEMKVFEGLSIEEMAERLGCSVRTVARHWNFGKRWLETELASIMGEK